ncbi:MAG: HEPN domain-containing protein [Armatimonadetes bacterium]|nr:HEPN domain-containing protein [Armatimonadota bacterium]
MTKEELISFWIEGSDRDFESMLHMFGSKDYHWALYVGHLVIEKLLKAYYIKKIDSQHPFIHNLLRLAEKSNLDITEEQKKFLVRVTTFNLRAKYQDYKNNFYKLCTKEFTEKWINEIKEFRQWIKKQL